MINLYDKNENLIGDLSLNCIECTVEEERNGLFELILTYPVIGDLYLSLEKENIIVADANDILKNQKFVIYNTRKYMKNQVTVYARHISFDLMHDVIENEISFTNQSCEYALNEIFRNSISSKHYKGYSNIVNAQNFKVSKINCLSAIAGAKGSIIDTFGTGAEILRDNTNIHVLNRRGHDNGVAIEYRKNLTGLEVEEDTTELVTRIKAYAVQKDSEGNEIEVKYNGYIDAPNINSFSKIYSKWLDFSDKFEQDEEVTQEKLKIYAEREYTVNKRHIPKCNYKIEFIPLSKVVGYEGLEDKISLCDTVTIKDTRYNIDTQAKVIKTVYNVLLQRYDSMELGEPKTSLGDIISSNTSSNTGSTTNPSTGGSDDIIVDLDKFPNTLPNVPVLDGECLGFQSVALSWTYENKLYYSYELYASKTKNFTPNSFNLIFEGQASAFTHEVKPDETWYYKVCAKNTYGYRTEFSNQVAITTVKIDNFDQYFSSLAVQNLVTHMFTSDYIKAGTIKGNWIDARNLTVTDGNGRRTLDIDSFGRVSLNVTSLNIESQSVGNFVDNKVNNLANDIANTYITNENASNAFTNLDKNLQANYPNNNNIITRINVSPEAVKIASDKIEIDGNMLLSGIMKMFPSYGSTNYASLYALRNGNGVNMRVQLGGSQQDGQFEVVSGSTAKYFWVNYQGAHSSNYHYFHTDKKNEGYYIDTIMDNGCFRPIVNDKGYLGHTSYWWNQSWINNMYCNTITANKLAYLRGGLDVVGTTNLYGYTVVRNNNLGVEKHIYCNGNIEALQAGYGQINCRYLGSHGNIVALGNLSVSGSKNCVQETENYGKRLINAYETADYYFGDIGESKITNGEAIIYLDDVFKEIITTNVTYQVFLTKYGKGDIWVEERNKDYFIVKAENDISFAWEIKGKRRGYEDYRLEEYVEEVVNE